MSFAVHAAPPPGEWFNDPTGLVFADGAWRLFVQHSAAAPDFREVGWARLSSLDLLSWNWDGPVIAPDALGQAYSGSVVMTDAGLAAYLTRHDGKLQRQVSLTSADAGATWRQSDPFGPVGRNVRDPFVFFCAATDDWRMLIAEPCDWAGWTDEAPSTLAIWRLDGDEWRKVGRIGPWSAPGILWEMPILVDFGACQALIVSSVDRRNGLADCAVRYWLGQFDGTSFNCQSAPAGLLLDHGPDFYAAIVDTPTPGGGDRTLVAWASSWATARSMPWPGGVQGGPVTLPRLLSLAPCGRRLLQRPVRGIEPASLRLWDGEAPMTIAISGEDASLTLVLDLQGLRVRRSGLSGKLNWERMDLAALPDSGGQTIRIFNDAGLIEVFIEPAGLYVTAFVPGARI